MTMILLLAKFALKHKNLFHHNLLFIFQPAEEGPGGALPMVQEGVLNKYHVIHVLGTHLNPNYEQGCIAIKSGKLCAGTSEFYITITGLSAHAAKPNLGTDAVLIGAHLVQALHTIVSRNVSPLEEAVLTVGKLTAGTRVNVIAQTASLDGTIRTYNSEVKEKIINRINHIATGLAEAYECTIDVQFVHMYPPVINDKNLAELGKQCISEYVVPCEMVMFAEDFSYFANEVPSLFFFTGTYNKKKDFIYDMHHSKFNFDEVCLIYGLYSYIQLALEI